MKLSVSYLSIKDNKDEEIKLLTSTTADYLHVDIMDGKFVLNTTEDDALQINWLEKSLKPLDIHFMVEDVSNYIGLYKELRPEYITFHIELEKQIDIKNIIQKLHNLGIKVGLSIKPKTPIEALKPYLDDIDLVLVMSVEPGKGGQSFIPSSLEKIKELKKLQPNYHFIIEVDGGINKQTSELCKEAGVDMIVVGSFITSSSNYQEQIDLLNL